MSDVEKTHEELIRFKKAWECLEERIKYRAGQHGITENAEHAIIVLMQGVAMRYGLPPREWD